MGIAIVSCTQTKEGELILSKDKIIRQTDNKKGYEVLHELQADLNDDGKKDRATIENHNDTIYFNIFESGQSTVTLSNDKVIFRPGGLFNEGMHYIFMNYDSVNKKIYIEQEFGSARPDGYLISWFGYKDGTYWVDSIAKDLKDYSQNPVSYIYTSAILNKELKEINLFEEFGNLNIEN